MRSLSNRLGQLEGQARAHRHSVMVVEGQDPQAVALARFGHVPADLHVTVVVTGVPRSPEFGGGQ